MSWWENKEDVEQELREPKKKEKPEKKEEAHKDRDCIGCLKFWDCKGKPRGVRCVRRQE